MCQVTPKESTIERRLEHAKAFLGDRHTLAKPQKRKTRTVSTAELHRRAGVLRERLVV